MTTTGATFVLAIAAMTTCTFAQTSNNALLPPVRVNNALAPTTTVYQPTTLEFKPKCEVKGPPLDLMFLVDFSGSVRTAYTSFLEMIEKIFQQIAVGPEAVRVSMVTFSARSIVRFPFNLYTTRNEYLEFMERLPELRGQASTSMYDLGMEEAYNLWDEQYGMRPDRAGVKRMMIIMGDGRSSSPNDADVKFAARIRDEKNVEVRALGLSEQDSHTIDANRIRTYISGRPDVGFDRYIVNRNRTLAFDWFKGFEGSTVCEEVPVCEPGAHAPVDLAFVIDLSSSVEGREQSAFNFVRRALNTVFVGRQSTRVAIVTYSNTAQTSVNFDHDAAVDRDTLIKKLTELQECHVVGSCVSSGGLSNMHEGLREAYHLYSGDVNGAHTKNDKGIERKKLVIVVSDGKSSQHKRAVVQANTLMGLRGATIFGVALGDEEDDADIGQLMEIAGGTRDQVFLSKTRVFAPTRACDPPGRAPLSTCLRDFERVMLTITDKSCPDLSIADASENTVPKIIAPTTFTCNNDGISMTFRFAHAFVGTAAVAGHESNPACRITGDGTAKEVTLHVRDGNCGLHPSARAPNLVARKLVARLRFHEYVETNADSLLSDECTIENAAKYNALLKKEANPNELVLDAAAADASLATCTYMITPHRQGGPQDCELLDAKVGTVLKHTWSCAGLSSDMGIFVHDCVADADDGNTTILGIVSPEGCAADPVLINQPRYVHKFGTERHTVSALSYAFKFPQDTIVRYRCMISVCDYSQKIGGCQRAFNGQAGAKYPMPSACVNHPDSAKKVIPADELPPYDTPPLKTGYEHTTSVRARRINVYVRESASIQYEGKPNARFCNAR